MFCRSLRSRPDLNELTAELVAATDPKMKESKLMTYDLAFSVPSRDYQSANTLRLLILTPSSLTEGVKAATFARIERFSALTGGHSVAIAFLLSSSNAVMSGTCSGLHEFSSLQIFLHSQSTLSSIPILPLDHPVGFLPAMKLYISSLNDYIQRPPPLLVNRITLLPYTASSTHPLSEHNTNVLSDICRSIADVATLAGSADGQLTLQDWLGDDGLGVAEFWYDECEL